MAVSMDLWGVQETGFYRPSIEDIKEAYVTLAKGELGDDIDTDDNTFFGKVIRILATIDNRAFERDEKLYYSMFPHTATGISLERHCDGVGLYRDGSGYAEHIYKAYGVQDYVVEAGTEFKNENGVEFYSVENAIINQPETNGETTVYYAEVILQCKTQGLVGNVNDIDRTVEVNTNIHSIEYSKTIAYGTEAESDPDLRVKYYEVAEGLGTGTREAIKASVLKVSGVNDVIILENVTEDDVKISENLTLKTGTYVVIVYSDNTANDEEIAKAIFAKQPLGVPQSGTVETTVADSSNLSHTVKFAYVEVKDIKIVVGIETDSSFTTSGEQEIKDNLTGYINSLGIGQEVIYTRLYDYIYEVTGVKKVTSLTLNDGTTDITVNDIEVAKVSNITVTGG